MRRLQYNAGLLFLTACLAGCAGEIAVGKPELSDADVQSRAQRLAAQPATREQAHALLGTPWLASEPLGFEVYRSTDTQHRMLLVLVPYPVPLPIPGEKLEAYTLVSYDSVGRITGIDAALGQESATSGGAMAVLVRADGIEFSRAQKAKLSIPLSRYLERRSAESRNACTVLVGCEDEGLCWTRVQVDGGRTRDVPLESLVDHSLVPIELSPGRHELRFTARLRKGEARGELDCVPGAVVYAVLSGKLLTTYTLAQQLTHGLAVSDTSGTVKFSSQPPAAAEAYDAMIYFDDDWLITNPP